MFVSCLYGTRLTPENVMIDTEITIATFCRLACLSLTALTKIITALCFAINLRLGVVYFTFLWGCFTARSVSCSVARSSSFLYVNTVLALNRLWLLAHEAIKFLMLIKCGAVPSILIFEVKHLDLFRFIIGFFLFAVFLVQDLATLVSKRLCLCHFLNRAYRRLFSFSKHLFF